MTIPGREKEEARRVGPFIVQPYGYSFIETSFVKGIRFYEMFGNNAGKMELLSQKIVVENLTIEITVHDLSHRMGFLEGEEPRDHLYVKLTARDRSGSRLWSTPLLSDDGKIKAFSTVNEALTAAKARISARPDLLPN